MSKSEKKKEKKKSKNNYTNKSLSDLMEHDDPLLTDKPYELSFKNQKEKVKICPEKENQGEI